MPEFNVTPLGIFNKFFDFYRGKNPTIKIPWGGNLDKDSANLKKETADVMIYYYLN